MFLRFVQEYISVNGGVHLDHIDVNRCFLRIDVFYMLFCKCFSKNCCLNKVIFPVTVIHILHYTECAFSFRVQSERAMAAKIIELLNNIIKTISLCDVFNLIPTNLVTHL